MLYGNYLPIHPFIECYTETFSLIIVSLLGFLLEQCGKVVCQKSKLNRHRLNAQKGTEGHPVTSTIPKLELESILADRYDFIS